MITTLDLPARETPRPQHPRVKGNYAGASMNRLTADWVAVILSADQETRGSLRMLRARSRQLCRDNAHASGLVASLKDNIIGPTGIGVNPRMRSPRGLTMKAENLAAWEAFQQWGERGTCTADGQSSWAEFQRLALGTWVTDGECFIRKLSGFDNAFGYALQMIDADQLDESYNVVLGEGQNQITQGIELDRWGRPLAYHFWENHPRDPRGAGRRVRILSADIQHLFLQLRPNQRRGVPLLTPVLIALKMLDGYTEAEITAARLAAAQGGFFTKTGEDALNGGDDTADDPESEFIDMEAEPGIARKLPVGWRFDQWDPSHPNGNFGEFQRSMLRVISCGVNTSYITLSHDLSDTSYSSGRVGLTAERDGYRAVQMWFGDRVIIPVYREVLRHASLSGFVTLPTPEVSRWHHCQLEPRGWTWVDPSKDVIVADAEVGGLFNSPQRICAARGIDFFEIVDEIAEAKAYCEEMDVDWPLYGKPQGGTPDPTPAEPVQQTKGAKAHAPRLVALRSHSDTEAMS